LAARTDTARTTVSSDGVELAVIEAGDRTRPPVVLIHGYPDTKRLWTGVIEELADRFHVIAYDVRGAGESSAPRTAAEYDFVRLGDDLEAVAEATAPGRRIHLVGHDWGGIQGWEFATQPRFRDRLASFTAVAAPSLDQVAIGSESLIRRGRLVAAARRGWRSWYIPVLLTPGGPQALSRLMVALAPRGAPPSLARDAVNGANLYRRNVPRRTARPRRDAVAHVPVQLIIPRGDRYIPEAYYELAERYAPGVRRRTVEGSHWLPRTEPELVARWIAEHVDQVESSPA
jgi:pimeloyl-ACP methyl ester carboxylesterase